MRKIKRQQLTTLPVIGAIVLFYLFSAFLYGCASLTKQLEKDYKKELMWTDKNKSWRN